jgi:hypothetical protein
MKIFFILSKYQGYHRAPPNSPTETKDALIFSFLSLFPLIYADDYIVRFNGVLVDGKVDCSIPGKSGLSDTGTFMFLIGGEFHPMLDYHGVVVQYGKRISFAALGFAKGMVVGQPIEMNPPISFVNGCIMRSSPIFMNHEAENGKGHV